jgi:HEAT repeat protein
MALLQNGADTQTPVECERLVLVEHMRSRDEDPVPLLCEYLADPRLRVRIIAAKTLSEVGDERAIGPLCRALETTPAAFRSGRRD